MPVTSEHLSDQEIARYSEQRLSSAELLAADDHLAACDSCFARIDPQQARLAYRSVASAFQNIWSDDVHLTYDQLVSLADGGLTEADRQDLEYHLADCPQCEAELQDLRALKTRLENGAETRYAPDAPVNLETYRRAKWQLRLSSRSWAGIAATVAIFLLVTVLYLRGRVSGLQEQVARLAGERDELLQTSEAARDLQDQLARLQQENDQLQRQIDDSAQTVVALNDENGRVTLDLQGNLSGLGTDDEKYQQVVKRALTSGRLNRPPVLAQLAGRAGTLMGAESRATYGLLSPVAAVVRSNRPTFRWRPHKGATSYVVAVFDAEGRKVAASDPLSGTEWTIPVELEGGRIYTWQVRGNLEGSEIVWPPPAASEARFKIVDEAKAAELGRLRQASGKSHLLMGVAYAEAGLLEEAEREFQALLRANPESAVAQKLMRSVRMLRR